MGLTQILTSILVGAVAGWLASIIMGTKGGVLRNIIIGIIGGFVGAFIFGLLQITWAGIIGTIVESLVGACVLIWIGRLIFK